jgi:hypothetical protein
MAGAKRKHEDDPPEQVYGNKSRHRPAVEPRVDPTYGQRSAIPGLDDETTMEGDEDWMNYDDDMDALAYLRAVRLVSPSLPQSIALKEILCRDADMKQ